MSYFPRLKESAIYRTGYFLVSLAVLLMDQWTKGVVMRTFQVHESREIVSGLFDLTYVQNSGAAFGLFASVDSSVKAIVLNSVAVLVFLILLIARNTRPVKLDYVFGSTSARLIWLIVISTIAGWVLGLVTSFLVRHRTREPR